MKTVLIILWAFFLKAEAEAQMWRKISPDSANFLKSMKVFEDDKSQLHLFSFDNTKLYYLKNGQNWLQSEPNLAGICHTYSDKYGNQESSAFYGYQNIVQLDRQNFFIQVQMICTGEAASLDYSDNYFNYDYNRRWRIRLDTFTVFRAYSPALDTALTSSGIINYDFRENSSFYYYFKPKSIAAINKSNLQETVHSLPGGAVIIDPRRDSTLYLFRGTTVIQNNTSKSVMLILQSRNNAESWDTVGTVPNPIFNQKDNITILENNPDAIFYRTSGLIRFAEKSSQVDTVLKAGVSILYAQNDSRNAYAGTYKGEIYRSSDAGETWSLFASGFSTKPVIGIYASGNDSLIVGTEDGIWANYVLPVSVTEEPVFKNNELSLTPNPANTSLKISFLKTELPQQLSVFNSLGQLVFKTEFSGEFVWDFKNDIPDGVYTVAVQSGAKSVAKQIVILK